MTPWPVFSNGFELTVPEMDYRTGGPLTIERDGRWIAFATEHLLETDQPVCIDESWIEETNRLVEAGSVNIKGLQLGSRRVEQKIKEANAPRLEVVRRLGWTATGGLFEELAAKEKMDAHDLPSSKYMVHMMRLIFAFTGARIMECLQESKKVERRPEILFASPGYLATRIEEVIETEEDVGLQHIEDLFIGYPGLLTQTHRTAESFLRNARMFWLTGGRTSFKRRRATAPPTSASKDLTSLTTWPIVADNVPGRSQTSRPNRKVGRKRSKRVATGAQSEELEPVERMPEGRVDPKLRRIEAFQGGDESRQQAIKDVVGLMPSSTLDDVLAFCPDVLTCNPQQLIDFVKAVEASEDSGDCTATQLQRKLNQYIAPPPERKDQ